MKYKNEIQPFGNTCSKYWEKPLFSCLLLFFLAAGVRVGAIFILETHTHPQAFDVHTIANNIVTGNGFSYPFANISKTVPSSYKSPLYVYFLTFFFLFGKNAVTCFIVQALQACLGGIVCLIIMRISNLFFPKPVGYISGFLYALFPSAIIIATRMHEINFTVPMLAWLILQLFHFHRAPSRLQAFYTGMAMGLSLLAEPSLGFFCLIALLYLLIFLPGTPKTRTKLVSIIFAVCFVFLLPWSVRNLFVHKKVFFIKNVAGYNLWIGNNPYANGTNRIVISGKDGREIVYMTNTMAPELKSRVQNAITEVEKDQILMQAALKHIKDHPFNTLTLALKKIKYLWWIHPSHSLAQNFFYKSFQVVLFITGIIGLLIAFRRARHLSILLFLLFGCQTVVYMAFFVLPRYRMVLDPYLIIGSVLCLIRFTKFWKSNELPQAPLP